MQRPDRADYSKYVEDPETGEVVQVHNKDGAELPDSVPMAPPLGYEKPLSMFDVQRAQIRAEHHRLRQMELEQLAETPEQANDFDVYEDVEDQPSLYEEKFDPVDFEVRSRLRQAEFRAEFERRIEGLSADQKELLNGDSLGRQHERANDDDGVARSVDGSARAVKKSKADAGSDKEPEVRASVRSGSDDKRGIDK